MIPDGNGKGTTMTDQVVWPLARATQQRITREERLPEVDGSTIAFVWDYVFRGDEMFSIIADELGRRARDVRFVDHTTFGDIHGAHEREVVAALPAKLRESGADAAIVGVGA